MGSGILTKVDDGMVFEALLPGILLAILFLFLKVWINRYTKRKRLEAKQKAPVNKLKRQSSPQDQNVNEPRLCKRCQSVLVLRNNNKTGEEFWGCSSFPKCRYTE